MIDHAQFENPNLRALARKLKDIPEVLQIRFSPLVSPTLVEQYAPDTFMFNLVIARHPDDVDHTKEIVNLLQYVTYDTYNEPYYHTACVERFAAMIKHYNENPNVNKSELTQLAWQPTVLWQPGYKEE